MEATAAPSIYAAQMILRKGSRRQLSSRALRTLIGVIALVSTESACGDSAPPSILPSPTSAIPTARMASAGTEAVNAAPTKLDALSPDDFNRRAADSALPFMWEDKNANKTLDPDELFIVWGVWPGAHKDHFVRDGSFTPHFMMLYHSLAHGGLGPPADAREMAVRKELAQSRPTLVATDLRAASAEDKSFVRHVMNAATTIEVLHQKQRGTYDLRLSLKSDDRASKMLFFRNQGPRCEAPLTQNDPDCSAVPNDAKNKLTGLYPRDLAADPKLCDIIAKEKDKKVTEPFTVVVRDDKTKKLRAVPFNEIWKDEMNAVAEELSAAAKDLESPDEAALRAYLEADARAFRTNDWTQADEAWAKMSADNSKWYLRIAPDETYREPCNLKALFHVSFGRINQKSKKWQAKLTPMKDEMEQTYATLAGAPYKARQVKFKLPDFVDIALNAGDARMPYDVTIGQSLPNFGPVAAEARGRTVAMPNFYTDADSVREIESQANTLFCKETMSAYTQDGEPLLMSTVLHEAGHNLGPNNPYKVGGRIDRDIFGGPLASTLEESKAETGSLFLITWLGAKNELSKEEVNRALLADVLWGFGQISKGLYDENKQPRSYAQLEAIQVGFLQKDGAMRWDAGEMAANGIDKGCFALDWAAMPTSLSHLLKEVLGIKARGDKKGADALIRDYVDDTGERKKTIDLITERMNRVPKASFMYAIDL
jgi:hypothetical protein